MPRPLVECIPNFSEARRPEIVDAIVNSITSIPGVYLLDRHSDLDHNRTVITFVGTPDVVEQAAFNSVACASKLIDLNQHQGEHPRIGAADVIPFVPISDISMPECVEIARRLGKRIGSELNIPVYLYEEAAARPERQNLENIRRGEYEGLKEDIATNPNRSPDFGPREMGPAGATVIGARQPLIAFNVYLTTNNVVIAQKIARAVRFSSGGLRFVKAMGVMVNGMAQVSMNLTNYQQTPIARVVETVRREAARYGVSVHSSELVGLAPQDAIIQAATWYLQLDDFQPDQLLERKLLSIPASATPQADIPAALSFLDHLAGGTPTPGGGSASAYSAAMGAALVAMVARLTVGKKKYADVEKQMWEIIEHAEELRKLLTEAVEEDAHAFDEIMNATRMAKDTPEQIAVRSEALERSTLQAIQVPLHVAQNAVDVIQLAVEVARMGNINAISDAGSAASLALAALRGAGLNVNINAKSLEQEHLAQPFLSELVDLENKAQEWMTQLRQALFERTELTLPN